MINIYTESIFLDLELYKEHKGLSREIKSRTILISCLSKIDKPILSHKVIVTKISLLGQQEKILDTQQEKLILLSKGRQKSNTFPLLVQKSRPIQRSSIN